MIARSIDNPEWFQNKAIVGYEKGADGWDRIPIYRRVVCVKTKLMHKMPDSLIVEGL